MKMGQNRLKSRLAADVGIEFVFSDSESQKVQGPMGSQAGRALADYAVSPD